MTEEEIMAVAIRKRRPLSTVGFAEGESIPQPHEIHGLPEWADIKVYNTAGWRWRVAFVLNNLLYWWATKQYSE